MFNFKNLFIMKKVVLLFVFVLLSTVSFAQNTNKRQDTVACSDFHVTLNLAIVSVDTTVYVCCGGPFISSPQIPCSVVTKKVYDMWTANKLSNTSTGVLLSDLVDTTKYSIKDVTQIEITSSSISEINGDKISIKKGIYKVDENNLVYLQVEKL